ncbi:MAG: hypothetical protein MJZ38_00960 [archaeon]|nr:hypothetical protein [archaeon]
MKANNAYALAYLILLIAAVVGGAAAYLMGVLDAVLSAVAVVLLVIIITVLFGALGVGIFTFFKKKDQVHTDSAMGLGDLTEVDREMVGKESSSTASADSGLSTDDRKE